MIGLKELKALFGSRLNEDNCHKHIKLTDKNKIRKSYNKASSIQDEDQNDDDLNDSNIGFFGVEIYDMLHINYSN